MQTEVIYPKNKKCDYKNCNNMVMSRSKFCVYHKFKGTPRKQCEYISDRTGIRCSLFLQEKTYNKWEGYCKTHYNQYYK